VPVNVENFAKRIERGDARSLGGWWFLTTNYKQVRPGDEVFIYSGDKDVGIIGYARVRRVRDEPWDASVDLKFDRRKTLQLLRQPVPAVLVRKWLLPGRIRTVTRLNEHRSKLYSLLPWKNQPARAKRKQTETSGAGFATDVEQNKAVEQAALRAVERYYKQRGWSVDRVDRERLGFDLICTKGDEVLHVEVKGIRGSDIAFIMTAGERRAARTKHFVLAVVCNALKKPSLRFWSGRELEREFKFTEIQYRVSLKTPR
jgi:Holliday junction resolvase-like predicted endonuclease